MSNDLDIDPDAVDIGDGLQTADGRPALAVTAVDADDEQVKVYSPTGEHTVNRWFSMDLFGVHRPNEDIETDADREQWLNETLPPAHTCRDGERKRMEYAIDDEGNVQRVVQA